MEFKLEKDVLTFFLTGKLNSSNSEEIEQEIDNILKNNEFKSVVFDLGDLTYISSAGLRILLRVKQEHDDTKLIKVSDEIYDIFDMVGFSNFLTIERK